MTYWGHDKTSLSYRGETWLCCRQNLPHTHPHQRLLHRLPLSGRKHIRALFADLDKACTEAETIATRLGNVEADVLTLTSKNRASFLFARSILDPLGISLAAAGAAEFKKRLGTVPAQRHPPDMTTRTTPEAVEELLALKAKDGLSAEYLRQFGMVLRLFAGRFKWPIGGAGRGDECLTARAGLAPPGRGTTCGTASRRCSTLRCRGGMRRRAEDECQGRRLVAGAVLGCSFFFFLISFF